MTTGRNANDQIWASQRQSMSKSGPSGATDRPVEREQKFDEEGGDQPQAPSERAVARELQDAVEQEQLKDGRNQEQWRNATSMGSEGRSHDESGQQDAPASFDDGAARSDKPADEHRRSFRHQAGR